MPWIIFSFPGVIYLRAEANTYAGEARVLAKKYDVSLARKFFWNDPNHVLYLNAHKIIYVYII